MKEIKFFRFVVTNQVFYQSKHTYALVNLRPLVPGHVLVVPFRTDAHLLEDLTPEESADYFQVVQLVQRFIKSFYKADALNIAMQDGPAAGQSVPHVHTHIIPRYSTDGYGDEIYTKIDKFDIEKFYAAKVAYHQHSFSDTIPKDEDRADRTPEVMERETKQLAQALGDFIAALDPTKVVPLAI